ncbi:MAG: FCD domain-containing protein [Tetrasphaera sp.]
MRDSEPRPASRAQAIASDIEGEILDREWPEGARLGLRTDLMERYGASPTVINEALGLLRERQLVEVRRGPAGGVYVADQPPHVRLGAVHLWFHPTNVSPAWMFELRVRIQHRAMPEAFARVTAASLDQLETLHATMVHTTEAAEYLEAAFSFHHVLVAAAADDLLEEMHRMVLTALRVALARAVFPAESSAYRARSITIHRQLIDALRAQDFAAFTHWERTQYASLIRGGTDSLSDPMSMGPIWGGLPEQ